MKKIKLGLFGGTGKMGQEISKVAQASTNSEVSFSVGRKFSAAKLACDVVIDFSSAEGMPSALKYAIEKKKPFVSGSTGLSKKDFALLKEAAKKIPVLWAPNMSPGVAAVKKALEGLAGVKHYSFHIEEWHHVHKKDQPSGTAIALAEKLKSVVQKNDIPTHSIRAGGVFGVHKIYAIGDSEYIEIGHHAMSRKVFAEGAVTAAIWIKNKKPGFYSMEDVVE